MSEERLERIEATLDSLDGGLQGLRQEMRTLNEDTRRHMGVLHEEVIDRIAALAPDFAPIRREFKQASLM
jgi:prefoldin subunit 5